MIKKVGLLSLTKIIQFSIPIIIYPYVIGVVGLEKFGLVTYWIALFSFISNFCGLNMDTFAIKKVLYSSYDSLNKSIIIPIIIKFIIAFVIIVFWWFYVFMTYDSIDYRIILLFSVYPFFTIVFFPTHYFVGRGDFKLQALTIVIEKIIFVAGVLLFVKSENDYYYLPLAYFSSIFISLLICNFILFNSLKLKVNDFFITKEEYKEYMKISTLLMFGKLTQLHTNAARFIIGTFFGYTQVAIYDICEKVINVCKVPMVVMNQALYAKVVNSKFSVFIHFFILSIMSVSLYFIVDFFSFNILDYLSKDNVTNEMISTFKILIYILLSIPLLLVFGNGIVVKNADDNLYGKLLVLSNLISIFFLILINYFHFSFLNFVYWVVYAEISFSVLCLLFSITIVNKFKTR